MLPSRSKCEQQAYGRAFDDTRGGCSVFTGMAPDRTDPFTVEGEWLRCALHAHTTGSDGELEPDALAAHYGSAGFDVLAITDHWKRTEAASNGRLLVLPSVELNCILPAARDGHVLGFGISADADLAALGAEYADLERTAGVHRRARRRRLPRPSLLDGCDSRHARAARERRRDRGLERRLRARGGAGAVLRALGRAARDRPPLLRSRDGRLPSSRLRLGPRLDLAARAGTKRRGGARRASPQVPSTAARGLCCTTSRSTAMRSRCAAAPPAR